MSTLLKWGLTLALAMFAFVYNALNPQYFENPPLYEQTSEDEENSSRVKNGERVSILSTIKPTNREIISVDALPPWERIVLGIRRAVDGSVKYFGGRLEEKIPFTGAQNRGYTALVVGASIIAALGLFLGHRHNVNSPNDGPSFSLSMLAGKFGLIAATFFVTSWLRDLAVVNLGDAAILAILFLSLVFAIFAGVTAFSRAT